MILVRSTKITTIGMIVYSLVTGPLNIVGRLAVIRLIHKRGTMGTGGGLCSYLLWKVLIVELSRQSRNHDQLSFRRMRQLFTLD